MMYSSVYGRLGKDAQEIQTRSGKPMAAASLAVDVGGRESDATQWVRVIAFGKLAAALVRHTKGDRLAASGRIEITKWTGNDGTERETTQLIADSIHSSRTVRPGGKRTATAPAPVGSPAPANPEPLDDPLTF